MADIELVIKIDEETYRDIQSHDWKNGEWWYSEEWRAIHNGISLDKHDEEVIAETVESIWGKPPYMDVLNKIRAEIEQLTITEGGEDYTRKMAELYSLKIKVLQIIDKYRGESDCRECKAEHDCYECEKYEESEEK